MKLDLIGLLSLLVLAATATRRLKGPKPPGLRIELTRAGLDYAATVGQAVLNHQIPRTPIPPISVKVDKGPGYGRAALHNVSIDEFEAPRFTYDLQPDSAIMWMSDGGRVKASGEWEAWYKVLIRAGLSGSVTAEATDLSLELVSELSQPRPGALPFVNISHCSADIGRLDLRISGGAIQWFINLFRAPIANKVKTMMEQQICSAASGLLQNMVNAQVQSLPTLIPLYKAFTLHYGMTAPPLVTDDYIRTLMQAEISWQGQVTPIRPPPLPNVPIPSPPARQLYITGSDFVLNSFFVSAHRHKAIQFLLRPAMLPPKMRGFLNTSCSRMCIGRLIPAIGRKFPNDQLDLHLYTIKAPAAIVEEDGAELRAQVMVDVFGFPIRAHPKHPDRIFALKLDFAADLQPHLVNDSAVAANMTITAFKLSTVSSAIGPIPPQSLGILQQMLRPALELFVNAELGKGVGIPTVEGVSLHRPELRLLKRAVLIETDFQYANFSPQLLLARMRQAS